MKEKYSFDAQKEVITHKYLYNAAHFSYDHAEENDTGSFYFLMTSLVFSAFSLEAYLNHVGMIKLPYWIEIDRIPPLNKLKVLYSVTDLSYEPSYRPIQTIKKLFEFRNAMAHGRTEKVSDSVTIHSLDPTPGPNLLETKWEDFCKKKNAERALDDVKQVMEELHKAIGLEGGPLDSLGSSAATKMPRNNI